MPLYILARHAHSTLNAEGRVNGDPSVPVGLTAEGRAEAERAGHQLAALGLELCVHTRFRRTRETADALLSGRDVPRLEEPLLDDVDVGELEGATIEDYRVWKRAHRRDEPFPGGESLDDCARRYALAFRRLLARPERSVLVVCHEIPVRYALNAAAGSDDLDGPEHLIPNATPYLFDAAALERAAARIELLVG
ncbi:MAG: alpha-ribazole phosphatase [Gaiellaceae bacterium]|nr:alpha-ribazole phosphatase [Gaiellaceae bacterium]